MDTWGAYHLHKQNFVHKNITIKIDVQGVQTTTWYKQIC